MSMPRQIKEKAFAMYCIKIPISTICEALDIRSRRTVYRWIEKDEWEQRKQEIIKIAKEKGAKDTTQLYLGIAKSVMGIYYEAIDKNRKGMVKKTTHRDAMEAVKLARLIEGQSTENIEHSGEVNLSIREALQRIKRKHKEAGK